MPLSTAQRDFVRVMQDNSLFRIESVGFAPASSRDVTADHHEEDIVATRLAVIQLAEKLGNVTQACRAMGFSRGTFYRLKARFVAEGEAGLRELDRRGRVPKNRFDPSIDEVVLELAKQHPTWGRRRFVALLAERGIAISASGVRLIWKRHGLLDSRVRDR